MFCAKEGRRRVVGVEVELGADGDGGRRFCRLDSAGVGHGRAREDVEWVLGEVAQLGVQRIEVGQRGTVDAELGGGSSSSLLRVKRKEGEGRSENEDVSGK